MNRVIAVIRREFVERVRTKAFIISTILLPVLIISFSVIPMLLLRGGDRTMRLALVDGSASGVGKLIASQLKSESLDSPHAKTPRYDVSLFPADNNIDGVRGRLVARTGFSDESPSNSWDGVLVVTDASISDGKVDYFGSNVGSIESMSKLEQSLGRILTAARLSSSGVSENAIEQAFMPTRLETIKVSEGKLTGQSGAAAFMIAYFMGFMLYLSIMLYGQQTMTSVVEEKTSRIMEVLVSSLTPFQMLLGKVIGVGMAGLLQMAIWGSTVFVLTSQRMRIAELFNVSPDALQSFPIPAMQPELLFVFLLYFALGFLLYGALYAAIGAICNTVQETQQYAVMVTLLIMIGFVSIFVAIKNPTGGLGEVLSFVPFFSPFLMPVRSSLTAVPIGQLCASLVIMCVALLAVIWIAARIYRTGILMYGKKPSWAELLRWLRQN